LRAALLAIGLESRKFVKLKGRHWSAGPVRPRGEVGETRYAAVRGVIITAGLTPITMRPP
jgi:hypothetical protein